MSSSTVVTPNPTSSPTGSPINPTNNPTVSPPSSSQQPTDQCNICGSGDASPHSQSDYCGTIATTVNGRTCQRWDAQSPHKHDRTATKYQIRVSRQTIAVTQMERIVLGVTQLIPINDGSRAVFHFVHYQPPSGYTNDLTQHVIT